MRSKPTYHRILLTVCILTCTAILSTACSHETDLQVTPENTAGAAVLPTPLLVVETSTQTVSPENTFTSEPQPQEAVPSEPDDAATEAIPTEIATPEVTEAIELPDEYNVVGVQGHKQYFPLGCETSVAVDWAAFFGVNINEFEFQTSLPLSDNPELGFVGSVEGPWGQVPPYAYGVHAPPVADLLQSYGVNAVAVKEMHLDELKRQLAMDHPVIAWVIGNVVGGVPYRYTDSQGNTTVVAAYEHTIIVIGYNPDAIRYNNNGHVYEIPTDVFLNSWGVLGNMAIVMGED